MNKQPLLNTKVDNVTLQEAVDMIFQMLQREKPSYVMPINVDVVMKMEQDLFLRQIADEADMVLVDGTPLVWIAKYHKHPVKEKVSGSDLVPALCAKAAEQGRSLFILGGKDGIAEQAKAKLEAQYPGIRVVGTYAPPLGFEEDEAELEKTNAVIRAANPDLLIACLGCPKQEKFIYGNKDQYGAKVSVCAGATVDFLAGNVKRAPRWMSNHGLEWFYRFTQEPKRLFKRYFIDDMKILGLVFKYR